MDVVLYEDSKTSGLHPVTLTRPAFDIRAAGLTLEEAVKFVFPEASIVSEKGNAKTILFLNARFSPNLGALISLRDMLGNKEGAFVVNEKKEGAEMIELSWKMFEHPEDIILFNQDFLLKNLEIMTKKMRGKRGVYLGKNTRLPKFGVFDTTKGPIVIGDNVEVRSFVVLRGPLFVGNNSLIKDFASISNSTIGPVCKAGGEIDSSILDAYTNKQHGGGLGHSYLGRFVNIGGGTYVSELKNTYSPVTMGGRDTGAQFLGAVFGDLAKTSVNASVFPGKIIGVSTHLYGTVTDDIPSFVSHVAHGKLFELPLAVAEKIQKAMAARRNVTLTAKDTALLAQVFTDTAKEREAKGVTKDKISFI